MDARVVRVLEVQGTSGYGGSEIHTRQLAEALAADPRFAVHVVIQPGGPVTGELRAAGIPVTELDVRHKFSRGARRALDEIIRTFQPDLVHTHIRNADWHGGRAARRHGRRWVTTIHDYINFDGQGQRTRGLPALVYRRLLRGADGIIAISRHIAADTAGQTGLPENKLTVIHNGSAAPAGGDGLRATLGMARDELVIGHLARLTVHKGTDVLLAALRLLPADLRWRALIAGDGPLAAAVCRAAAELPAGRVVHLPARRDVGDFLRACDVLAVPSRWEAFGRSITEALAAGCPVAASNVGGVAEIIEDGVSGRLVAPEDPAALAAVLRELLIDAAQRARLRAGGQARWREFFTVERFQRLTLDCLWRAATAP